MSEITVLGAGAFGTALAISLANAGRTVTLVTRGQHQADAMNAARENTQRLPGATLPDNLIAAPDIPAAPGIVLAAIPTQALHGYLLAHAAALSGHPIVACNKGIDMTSGLGPTGIIEQALGPTQAAILSGPGFAADIAAGLPTALTLAAREEALAQQLQEALTTPNIRLYRSSDVAGVEMGGALKNVVAIACGLTIGAGLGESARAALMTRGYAELSRIAAARGAQSETLLGLSGLGDLVLTCTSEKSRNYSFGLSVARTGDTDPTRTVEGVATAKAVSNLAKSYGLETPITDMVNAVLAGKLNIEEARDIILSRPLRKE